MTDDKKHDEKDRQKISGEELEDVAGGASTFRRIGPLMTNKKKPDTPAPAPAPDPHHHEDS